MTDEALCNALRYEKWDEAADRIEALTAKVKLMDDLDVINGEKIEALTEQLKTVLDREAATHFRHDAKTDELEAKLEKTVEGLRAFKAFDDMPTKYKRPDVFEVSVRRKLLATLAEIEGEKT